MEKPTAVLLEGTDIVRIVINEDRLDVYNAPALRELSVQLVSELHYRQILDCEGVRDADSAGLGVIVGAEKRSLHHGGCLVLANVGVDLAHTLRITGLDKKLVIASDIASAVAFFNIGLDVGADLAGEGGAPDVMERSVPARPVPLEEVDPELITALTLLIDRFGLRGVAQTLAQIETDHAEYAATEREVAW